jgi:Ni/Fe-hydrogenase b-type cytochrome subunit
VVNGRWATRDCANCHSDESILAAPFTLSGYLPGGELPSDVAPHGISFDGLIETTRDGSTAFRPDARQAGFYIIGLHSVSWVDRAGVLMFAAVWIGVLGHAIGRYISRRRGFKATPELKRVYMYRTYERLWHWIQTIAILLLLFTGLIIHKPDVFSIFSFPYVVDVHNVLGFILLINAALSLFYHLASGEIQQYLPEPRDFFARAIIQAMYYSRGIFRGEGHPFEKSKHKKLNPLQQITYLGILNVLLPAQVITGILIWGAQRWPEIANALGGLPLLAPLHTLIAWLFATFIVMHVYLTTAAGHTPTAGIQSMVTGWEDVEKHPGPSGNSAAQE